MSQTSDPRRFSKPQVGQRIAIPLVDGPGGDAVHGWTLWAAIVILCREILVSGLREDSVALRVSVPVTKLAKWKTTIQLVAIGFLIAGEAGEAILPATTLIGIVLLWISAIFTMYTGWDYFRAGIHHLIEEDEG